MQKRIDTLMWLFIAIALTRLISMAIVPLTDTTEARYGEIARIMAETGDFITPWFDYGVPFWGKPPLSFWTQAISFKLLGMSEFALRLPSWLATIATTFLVFSLIRAYSQRNQALLGAVIYSTMILSYVMAGAVLTDPFLTLGTTLTLVSFIRIQDQPTLPWRWFFFIGLAIGLLSKGPLALVLTGTPIFVWLVWSRQWALLQKLPWLRGTTLTAVLTLPWYIAAELKTPGFLNYFIIGEHFLRFLDSGWQGDLYGSAHKQPHGMIWLHWLVATLPWGTIALYAMIRHWIGTRSNGLTQLDGQQRLLLLAALFPGLFFTLSGNILWTYQLPALPPLAMLLALILYKNKTAITKPFFAIAALMPLIVLGIGLYSYQQPDLLKTEKTLVAYYNAQPEALNTPLIYLDNAQFSARYYTQGKVISMTQAELLAELNNVPDNTPKRIFFCAIKKGDAIQVRATLTFENRVVFTNKRYVLIRINT